jgi:hypothetical protein
LLSYLCKSNSLEFAILSGIICFQNLSEFYKDALNLKCNFQAGLNGHNLKQTVNNRCAKVNKNKIQFIFLFILKMKKRIIISRKINIKIRKTGVYNLSTNKKFFHCNFSFVQQDQAFSNK